MIIDTHAHLTDDFFKDNINQVVNDFEKHNIEKVFTIGYNIESSQKCVALANEFENVYACIGIHPSDILELSNESLATLKQLSLNKKVLAIGEIGLDHHYSGYDKQMQINGFVKQLELAHECNLPIVIHTRDASDDLVETLTKNKHLLQNGGIVHCFDGDINFFNSIKNLGLIISLGGSITFKNSTQLQETVKNIPLSHIVLETDSPYLTPVPFRGKERNQPKFINYVAKQLAQLHNVSEKHVIETTTKNVYELFKKLTIKE